MRTEPASNHARQCLVWGWALIVGVCLLALIPFVGMLAWFIGPPLMIAALVLAIIAMTKGSTGGGVVLLIFSLTIAPVTFMLAPIVAAMLGGAAANASQSKVPAGTPPPAGFVPRDFDPAADTYPAPATPEPVE